MAMRDRNAAGGQSYSTPWNPSPNPPPPQSNPPYSTPWDPTPRPAPPPAPTDPNPVLGGGSMGGPRGGPRGGPGGGSGGPMPATPWTPPDPSAANLSGYGQAQPGQFPNSFVNLQAYLNADPNAPPYRQQTPTGNYSQGQGNLDAMLKSAYYGPLALGPTPYGTAAPSSGATPSTGGPALPQPSTGGSGTGSGSTQGPLGATPQPGLAQQQGQQDDRFRNMRGYLTP